MSTYFSLLSTLSLEECLSRLEEAGKQETLNDSGVYYPLQCKVSNLSKTIISFTIRKRKDPKAMFVFGRVYEVEGMYKTLITYSVGDPTVPNDLDEETNERLDRLNKNIGMFFLLISLFGAGYFTANANTMAKPLICSWIAVITLGLLLFQVSFTKRQRNKDVAEMVIFIKKTIEAQ